MTLHTLTTYLDFNTHQVDVVVTYLQRDCDKEIYMKISDSIEKLGFKDYY